MYNQDLLKSNFQFQLSRNGIRENELMDFECHCIINEKDKSVTMVIGNGNEGK